MQNTVKNPTLWERFATANSIDIRSLAAFRIAVGLITFKLIFDKALDLKLFFTEDGIFPRSLAWSLSPYTSLTSINMAYGAEWFQQMIFICALISCTLFILGYKTKVSTLITWYLVASIQSRNEFVTYGADQYMRIFLFWSLFLPLNLRWSVDHVLQRKKGESESENKKIFSPWTMAIIWQLAIIYFFAGLLKTYGREWTLDGSAIYYALNYDILSRPFSKALLNYPETLKYLTWATLALELVCPFLLVWPAKTLRWRNGTLFCLVGLHLGIALTLNLRLMPFSSLTGLLIFFPTELWNFMQTHCKRSLTTHLRISQPFSSSGSRHPKVIPHQEKKWLPPRRWQWVLSSFFILYTVFWNYSTCYSSLQMPAWMFSLGNILRIDQNWAFFAPRPYYHDGFWISEGHLKDDGKDGNKIVDPINLRTEPPNFDKPATLEEYYPNGNWVAYYIGLKEVSSLGHIHSFHKFLCRRWKEAKPTQPLQRIDLFFMDEITPRPGEPFVNEKVLMNSAPCSD